MNHVVPLFADINDLFDIVAFPPAVGCQQVGNPSLQFPVFEQLLFGVVEPLLGLADEGFNGDRYRYWNNVVLPREAVVTGIQQKLLPSRELAVALIQGRRLPTRVYDRQKAPLGLIDCPRNMVSHRPPRRRDFGVSAAACDQGVFLRDLMLYRDCVPGALMCESVSPFREYRVGQLKGHGQLLV